MKFMSSVFFIREENGIISSDPAVGTESLKEKLLHKKRRELWQEVHDAYLDKKNNNQDHNKRSYSLYAETINEYINEYFRRHSAGRNKPERINSLFTDRPRGVGNFRCSGAVDLLCLAI